MFKAAPFNKLSDTIHILIEFSWEESWRILDIKVSNLFSASTGVIYPPSLCSSTTIHPGDDDKTFLKNIRQYTFSQDVNFEDRDEKSYHAFLNKIIPSNKKLFDMISKYIKNDTSYYAIIKALEPFLIYMN